MDAQWLAFAARLPSVTTLRRHTFSMDCALVLVTRWSTVGLLAQEVEFVLVLLVDSSPRMGGRVGIHRIVHGMV